MKIKLLALALSALAMPALAGQSLVIKAGETYTVNSPSTLRLDSLVMENNSRIVVAPGLKSWGLEANRARIGDGARIEARGPAGIPGVSGVNAAGQAEACKSGVPGGAGDAGKAGGNGTDLRIRLGLEAVGALTVDSSGGSGGAGGAGGAGQAAGEVKMCNGPAGGAGGAGGKGGDGGRGGNITLLYWAADHQADVRDMADRISAVSEGGVAGAGGTGGAGGKGSTGHFETGPSLSGGQKWVPGGKAGEPGAAGASGASGSRGAVAVQEDVAGRVESMLKAKPETRASSARDEELELLRSQMKVMQQRLEALEKK